MNNAPSTLDYLPPPACIGILGAGQLGRMLVHAAQAMGYSTVVLDPDANAPAAQVSQSALQYAYDDPKGIAHLASLAQRVTTEFENVPARTLTQLSEHVLVRPGAQAVSIAQDRIAEKNMIRSCQLQTAPFHTIECSEDVLSTPPDLLPGLLKTARLGYDGKGQVQVKTLEDLALAYETMNASSKEKQNGGNLSCVLEKKLPLLAEYSVILARNELNQMVNLPIQCNQHLNGILHLSTVFKGSLPHDLERELILAAQTIAQNLSYIGVLCVEFFVLQDPAPHGLATKWVVNEIAPRPHNSGHHSLNSCDISQFELQLRTLCGLPLIAPRQHSPCVMLNLLGDLWLDHEGAEPVEPAWADILALPGTHLHLYGKREPRRARKMGHLNITGVHAKDTLKTLEHCLSLLGLPAVSPAFLEQHFRHDH